MTDKTPYDTEQSVERTDPASEAAESVLDDLKGRKGFDHWWDDIDPEIKEEVRRSLADDIRSVYSGTDADTTQPDAKLWCPECDEEFAPMKLLRVEEIDGDETAVNHIKCLSCDSLLFERVLGKSTSWISKEELQELRGEST